MSLIQGIITEDFILVGYNNDSTKPNRVFKPNKQIIVACKEELSDCAVLLKDYCSYTPDTGFSASDAAFDGSYQDFTTSLSSRFEEMKKEHEDASSDASYKISCIVCGHNEKEFEITIFTLGMEDIAPNGIIRAKKVSTLPYQGITLGDAVYSQMLHALIHTHYHEYKGLNLLRYKYILTEVLEEAKKNDTSIQGSICFERVRKNDLV